MTPLNEYYKQLLEAIGCTVAEDGTVMDQHNPNKPPEPIVIKIGKVDKVLVLATKANLADCDWDKHVAFHPACEGILCGQSEVLNMYLYLASTRIWDGVQMAVASITSLALNKDLHGKLNLAQKKLLISCDGIDNTVQKLLLDINKKQTGVTGKHPLLSLRLERGGEIDDETYMRTCHLMTHVLNGKDNFCGVHSQSVKAKQVVRNLYEYVFPKQRVYGSNSNHTPYLFALLECFYGAAKHLNEIKTILGKHSPMQEIPLAWHEHMKDLNKLYKRYLPQSMKGNTGHPIKAHEEETASAPEATHELVEEVVETKSTAPKSHLTKLGIVEMVSDTPKVPKQQGGFRAPAPVAAVVSQPVQQQAPATTQHMLASYLRNQQVSNVQQYTGASFGSLAGRSNVLPQQQLYPPACQTTGSGYGTRAVSQFGTYGTHGYGR